MSKNKKVIIGILIVLIIVIGVVVVYKVIENSVTNRADFDFKIDNISSNFVDTENQEKNEIANEQTAPTNSSKTVYEKKALVEKDESQYGDSYESFKCGEYKEKPARIVFKQENTINEFYVFNKNDDEYEHLLEVIEDRMYYAANQDFNLWCFTPYVLDDISKSNENFIVFDYDEDIKNKDYTYENDFNRDIFFRFSNRTRLYRLLDYLVCLKESVKIDELKDIIGKDDFIPKDQIVSGYKYMNPSLYWD